MWISRRVVFRVPAVYGPIRSILLILVFSACCCAATGEPAVPLDTRRLDGPLQPFEPKSARSETQLELLEAAARFALARRHEGRGQFSEALRHYQRAAWHDRDAPSLRRTIVRLAVRLNRLDEAGRYATTLDTAAGLKASVLRRLAVHFVRQGDWQNAAKLYELVLADHGRKRKTPQAALMRTEIGRLHYINGDPKKAASYFADVIKALAHPNDHGLKGKTLKLIHGEAGGGYKLFAAALLEAGRYDEASAAFKNHHEAAPNKTRLAYNLARVDAGRGKVDVALAGLQVYFDAKLTTERSEAYELLAKLLTKKNQADQLIPRLEKLSAADGENLPLRYFLARQYLAADRLDDARRLFDAIRVAKDSVPSHQGLAVIARRQLRIADLLERLTAITAKTGSFDALGEKETAQLVADSKTIDALIQLAEKRLGKEAKDDNKLTHIAAIAVARLSLRCERLDVAAKFFEAAMKSKPKARAETIMTWGVELLLAGKGREAIKVLQRGLDDNILPADNPSLYFYLAGAHASIDQTDDALQAALKAGGLRNDSPQFVGRVGWVLYRGKRLKEAAGAYERLIAKFDGEPASDVRRQLRTARITLSNIYVLQEDMPQAEEQLRRVLDEFPADIGAQNDLGYLWADQGKHLERSLQMIQQAVDAQPDNVAYLDSLGWVNYRLGRYEAAVKALQKAAAQGDADAVILDHLGDAFGKAGRTDEALQSWRKAIQSYKKDGEKEKLKAVKKKIQRLGQIADKKQGKKQDGKKRDNK
jgi:tetratricopeptide (TPR) repeat protein